LVITLERRKRSAEHDGLRGAACDYQDRPLDGVDRLPRLRIKERIGRHTSELRRTVGFLCEVRQHLRRFAAGWHDAVVHGQVEQPGASGQDGGGAAQAFRRATIGG
jgi:hypothetical protein